jgi:hypothetical protein
MYLKKITLMVIIGIIASFSIRTFGTIFPQVFKNFHMVKATILVSTVFVIFHLLFWLIFYKEYASSKDTIFKNTCLLAVIGSAAVSLLYIRKLPFVFDAAITFPAFLTSPYTDAFVPLVSSLLHLVFFIVFKRSIESKEKEMLDKPILSIIIGVSIFICFHLIVVFNFIATNQFNWLEHMPRIIAAGTIPLLIIAVLLMLNFYYRFYRFLREL